MMLIGLHSTHFITYVCIDFTFILKYDDQPKYQTVYFLLHKFRTNEVIRKKVGTTSVLDFIKKQQIKWFGHVSRLPSDSAPQRAMLLRYNGYKAKGRPRKRWTSEITEATKETIYEAHTRARFRNLFLT